MSSHMPPVPPANRSTKGSRSVSESSKDKKLVKHEHHANAAEEGDTANIRQNTTNKGFLAFFGTSGREPSLSGVAANTATASPELRIKFLDAPLCFDHGTTHTKALASPCLPGSCPKNGDVPKSPLSSIGSAGARRLAQQRSETLRPEYGLAADAMIAQALEHRLRTPASHRKAEAMRVPPQ